MNYTNKPRALSATMGTALALVLVGALLVKYRVAFLEQIVFIIGVLLAVVGLLTLVTFLKGKTRGNFTMLIAITEIAFGMVIALFPNSLVQVGFVLIGVLILVLGFIQLADFLHYRTGTLSFVFALLRISVGVLLIALPWTSGQLANTFALSVGIIALIVGLNALFIEA